MAVSTTETIGFGNQFVQFLEDNKAALQAQGLDVTNWITDGKTQISDALSKDAEQDNLRAALKSKTAETNTAVKLVYNTTSSRLDAVMGVIGKNTPLAKQAGKLRSSINKQYNKKKNGEGES